MPLHKQPTPEEIFSALAAPFPPELILDVQVDGKTLTYPHTVAVMNRLDEVLGPANWGDEYFSPEKSATVYCRLTITYPWGEKVSKTGAGVPQGTSGLDSKTAADDALRRAAVKFGVGRDLYGKGLPSFAMKKRAKGKRIAEDIARITQAMGIPPHAIIPVRDPSTGEQLYGWLRDRSTPDLDLCKEIQKWARGKGFHWKVTTWEEGEVIDALAEAKRMLETASLEASPSA
jgi:hypothetical protein